MTHFTHLGVSPTGKPLPILAKFAAPGEYPKPHIRAANYSMAREVYALALATGEFKALRKPGG